MSTPLAPHLEAFFTQRLMEQKRASEHTIASYRDTFRLLLGFMQKRSNKTPSAFALEDIDAALVGAFLRHLEEVRKNSVVTRNVRLAAIRSFFRFLVFREPALSGRIQGVLAIPNKRTDRKPVEHLTQEEVDAVLAAPDANTWMVVGIGCSWRSRSIPGFESRSSSGSDAAMSNSVRGPMFVATARVERSAAPRCASRW